MNSQMKKHRVRPGRVWTAGASIPMESGCVPLLVWMCLPIWKLSKLHTV